jgi:FdhD protein
MMATPMDLEDFALGFSLSEAIIDSADEFKSVHVHQRLEGIEIAVRIPDVRAEAIAQRQRNLSGRSSCGLCGTQQLEDVVRHPPLVGEGPVVPGATLHRALAALDSAQPLNSRTGATHAAAWSDLGSNLVLVREDVGRHNALDKLVGAMATRAIPVQEGFLVLTSRASYEMVQKAATI